MRAPKWMSQLASDKPGERFTRSYRRRQIEEKGRPWLKLAAYLAAFLFLIGGVVFMILPVVPGFFLAIPAVAVLVGSTRKGAEWLDRTEVWLRQQWERLKVWWRNDAKE